MTAHMRQHSKLVVQSEVEEKLPWHTEEGSVEAINICQLLFLSLEGL